jgi:hypothetical protein
MLFLYRELVSAISPRLGLSGTLDRWPDITRQLADTPRKRRRHILS